MTSAFDPASFLHATTTDSFERRPPLPVGDYTAVIGEISARSWQGKADPSKSGIAYDVPLTLEIPAHIQSEMGIELSTLQLKDSIMLDLTPQGTIDSAPGKNRGLRMYREATDLNKKGEPFSAPMLTGKVVLVKIAHEEYEGNLMERVKGVARIG